MKSKLRRILEDLRAQRESMYGRRFANQSTPRDLMRLAKETLPNATPLAPEEGFVSMNFFWSHFLSRFDVKRKKGRKFF
jgi:hypothetical protein